ncbi:unnamed protein product [Prorocentrum cordatum]|uniref:Tryptophan synthase n=1 Tax=Prorocentrum cordatum TaxID=2364126 RepID=A0ABN9XHT0_9DINO|nr:unnamed protein product [Polarella glacialis]
MFTAFLPDKEVQIVGVEAGGVHGPWLPDGSRTDKHAATLTDGVVGVLHGSRTYLLQTPDGQIKETHSISAGLDYPGVGPQHASLKATGRVDYKFATDSQALDAMRVVSRKEGIVPALESPPRRRRSDRSRVQSSDDLLFFRSQRFPSGVRPLGPRCRAPVPRKTEPYTPGDA